MKSAFSFAAVIVLFAAPAFAGEGRISRQTLGDLGLGELQVMSDVSGDEIRGRSGNAMTMGLSVVSGLVIDPATKSFVIGGDANAAMATAENAGKHVFTSAAHTQNSNIALALDVVTPTSSFTGILIGGAGGEGFAFSR